MYEEQLCLAKMSENGADCDVVTDTSERRCPVENQTFTAGCQHLQDNVLIRPDPDIGSGYINVFKTTVATHSGEVCCGVHSAAGNATDSEIEGGLFQLYPSVVASLAAVHAVAVSTCGDLPARWGVSSRHSRCRLLV